MKDPRYTDLSKLLVSHSCALEPGEKVLIECYDIPPDFTAELIRHVSAAGGLPFISTYHNVVQRALYQAASDEQMKMWSAFDQSRMKQMDAYIGVRGSHNVAE